MKNLYHANIFVAIIFVLVSCTKTKDNKEKQFNSRLIVKNNTNLDIKIKTFCNNNLVFMGQNQVQTIKKNSLVQYATSFGGECPPPPIWGLISLCVDSVIIDFEDVKRLTHTQKLSIYSPTINNSLNQEIINDHYSADRSQ